MTKNKLCARLSFLLCIALIAGMLLSIGGCAAPAAKIASDLMADVHAADRPANPNEPDEAFLTSVGNFSWRFFQASLQNGGNIMISPASVYIALGMALNGADESTRTAMLEALTAENLTVDQIDAACRDWMTLLMNVGEGTQLSVANSIWYRQGFNPDPVFLQKNADYFAAAARSLDFSQQAAVDTINGWVKDNTQGKIEEIVKQINPDVVMYLINAVYFKADWAAQFDANSTRDGEFAAPAGNSTVKYMNRLGTMDYIHGDGVRGVLLPYKDERFAFVALLPDAGVTPQELVKDLTAEKLSGLLAKRQKEQVALQLPKFECRYEDSLKNELAVLGMAEAFDPGMADFSLMNAEHSKNLFISEVMHKTYCRVDEKGTEAAAVTSIEVGLTAMPVADQELAFNRPFVYGIFDTTTGLPLFLGLMEDPA